MGEARDLRREGFGHATRAGVRQGHASLRMRHGSLFVGDEANDIGGEHASAICFTQSVEMAFSERAGARDRRARREMKGVNNA